MVHPHHHERASSLHSASPYIDSQKLFDSLLALVGSPITSPGRQLASRTITQPRRPEDIIFSINTELITAKQQLEDSYLREYQKYLPANVVYMIPCSGSVLCFPRGSSKRTRLFGIMESVVSNLRTRETQCICSGTSLYFTFLGSFKTQVHSRH